MKNESKHLRSNEKKWDKWAKTLDNKNWKNDFLRRSQSQVITLADIKEGTNFLDIGCGTGWAIGEAAKRVDGKGLFYGVDLSPKMIEKAELNFKDRGNFHFIQANVESIPLEDNFFDVIICTNSFHHYLNPDKALEEMYRLLKTGGKLYILDPTADKWILRIADKIIKLFEPEHVKIYSTKEFHDLFIMAGFKCLDSGVAESHHKIHVGEK
jgi:ubiquinone/menaquinone biosynthesis C-methylase UbiE